MTAYSERKLTVVTLDSGDGIAPEILGPAVRILEHACNINNIELSVVPLSYGRLAMQEGKRALPAEVFKATRQYGFVIKTPSSTFDGQGGSFNVTYRMQADLYAGIRWVRPLMPSRATFPDTSLVVVRENKGGNYGGREFSLWLPFVGRAAFGSRVLKEHDVLRTQRLMFRCADRQIFPGVGSDVYVHHKANILPVTEHMRKHIAGTLAADYPDVAIQFPHVDVGAMWIPSWRSARGYHEYENLMGDVQSEGWCGRTGGITLQGSVNVGDGVVVAETAGGTAPDIAGRGIANPTGLIDGIVTALYMAEVAGTSIPGDLAVRVADTIARGLGAIFTAAKPEELTSDLGGTASTESFTDAVIGYMTAAE